MPCRSWIRRPSGGPRGRGGALLGLALLGLALLGLALVGATCEEQDYTAPDRLELRGAPPFEPVVIELVQPYRGLNTLDFRIVNTGEAEARFGLYAAVWYETRDDGETPVRVESTTSRVTEPLAPRGEATGRLYESELGLGERLHLEFLCYADDVASAAPCSGTLELTVLLRQVECRSDSDCAADEVCEEARGRCRTGEESDTSCQAVAVPVRWHLPVLTALALVVATAARSRRGR
jgi:hypothetical protein